MSPFFVPLLVASAAATRPDNVAALCELYFATEGPNSWVNKAGWSGCGADGTAATDPCNNAWFGSIVCVQGPYGKEVWGAREDCYDVCCGRRSPDPIPVASI